MSTYTKEEENIYFLNDKNIAQTIGDDTTSKVNSIPSLDLINNLCATTDQISSNLTRDLSTYANDLSNALCATVNTRREEDKAELSNVLSTYANQLCTQVSIELSVDRVLDKAELSNVLSSYTDSKIISLSSSLSDQINNEFVHKSGDIMHGRLTIDSSISVKNNSKFDGNIVIKGNLTQGEDSAIKDITHGIALGVKSEVAHNYSFVWNGDEDKEYFSNKHGTFNINPEDGTNGIYIGNDTLCSLLSSEISLTAKSLQNETYEISNALCATVDIRRDEDKAELSNVLSTYANNISNSISNTVEENRDEDKAELSNVLSTYANDLCASISSTIENAGYALYDKFDFKYDSSNHLLLLAMQDCKGNPKELSVEVTDFIKDRIIDHIDIKEEDGKQYLVIYFKTSKGLESFKIALTQLAQIYNAGNGIDIVLTNKGYEISVTNYNQITSNVQNLLNNVDHLSTTTYNELTSATENVRKDLENIQGYVNSLSIDDGIIDKLRQYDNALSNHFKYDIDPAINDTQISVYNIINDIDDTKSDINGLTKNVQILSNDVSSIYKQINHDLAFVGHIKVNFNNILNHEPQSWEDQGYGNTLSGIFKFFNFAEDGHIKNGSIYDIIYTNIPSDVSDDDITKMKWITTDNFTLKQNDFIVVHAHQDQAKVPIEDIGIENVFTLANGLSADFYSLSTLVRDNYVWLSGDNNLEAKHAISGNNDFLNLNNFEQISVYNENVETISAYNASIEILSGYDVKIDNLSSFSSKMNNLSVFQLSVEQLSASRLSVNNLSGYEIVANGISACQLSANNLSAYRSDIYDLSVGNNLSVANKISVEHEATFNSTVSIVSDLTVNNTLTVTVADRKAVVANLSAGTITADWNNVKHTTGYSLFDLSTALSNKIWIDDQVNHDVNGTSDLSIVKIAKDDFDALVADEHSIMSGNTLFVVDSDYIDAYGQVITNLAMDRDDPSYMLGIAASKPYVDFVSSNISATVDQNRIADKNELSNVLSTYTNNLCVSISSTVDQNRIADKNELSNVLSTYANDLCVSISSTVDQNRIADKNELSNVLSTYTDNEMQKLSNVLSSISYSLKHDCILSNGITNDSNISTILSATVYIFNLLSSL